jgi:hypothetical protein
MIRPNAAGQVFATELQAGPRAAQEALFGNFPTHAGRGAYVIEFTPKQGVFFRMGKPGELIHQGTLRFGRQIEINFAGPNPY